MSKSLDMTRTDAWSISTDGEFLQATLKLSLDAEAVAARRQLYHDYLAATRTLRYLAQKALDPNDENLKAALQKHMQNLDRIKTWLVDPLLHPDQTHD